MLILTFLFLIKCINANYSECTQKEKKKQFNLKSIEKKNEVEKASEKIKDFYFHKNGNKILSFRTSFEENKFNDTFFEFHILIDDAPNKSHELKLINQKNNYKENSWKIYFLNENDENKKIEPLLIKKIRPNKGTGIKKFPEKRARFGNIYKISFPILESFPRDILLENEKGEILKFSL